MFEFVETESGWRLFWGVDPSHDELTALEEPLFVEERSYLHFEEKRKDPKALAEADAAAAMAV